jgi:hypothetical protein
MPSVHIFTYWMFSNKDINNHQQNFLNYFVRFFPAKLPIVIVVVMFCIFNFILIMFHDLYLACILQKVTQHCNLISNGRHYIAWPYLVGMSICTYITYWMFLNKDIHNHKQNFLNYFVKLPIVMVVVMLDRRIYN